MPLGIGWMELVILLLVALLIFGPKRLPEMGRSLGRGMREFKDSVSGKDRDDEDDDRYELPPPREETVSTAPSAPSRKRKTVS